MSRGSKGKAPAVRSSAPASPTGEMPGVAGSRSPESEGRPAGLNDRWTVPGICIFLAAIIWVVFGQTLGHGFVNFDDWAYVYDNPEVARGLTLKGIVWAFTHVHSHNWHPLTWISHMLDCQFYGLNPGGHHLTNILFHTATAILLFLVLRRMTGALWRSAFVAAVFAIHPLRVESVAWVAERKDVLSGLFFMLTIGTYVRYVQKQSRVEGRESNTPAARALDPLARRSEAKMARLWTLDYCLVLLFFALGLMCKPMLVTLPFVLLLLDYWPLGRISEFGVRSSELKNAPQLTGATKQSEGGSTPWRDEAKRRRLNHLLYEKLPLFGLAAASSAVTIFAQTEAMQSFRQISFPLRVGNALTSCVAYLGQMFWPSGLALPYPFVTRDVGISEVLSLILLAGISTGVFILRRRPYLLTGWLWYLIMLGPVIGIIQVGVQARADRYTYLPQIGLYLLLTWAVADLCAGWRHRRVVLGGCATVILVALIFCARNQVSYWRNSESLWAHTLACTSDNYIAHDSLGDALLQKGNVDEAIVHFQKAVAINPDYAEACYNLGNALLQKGSVDEAMVHFQKAVEIDPGYAKAHNNLGITLLQKGSVDEAIVHFQKALEIEPDHAEAHYNLGNILLQKGSVDEAIVHYQKALGIKPDYTEAHNNLGSALNSQERFNEAIIHYQKALEIKPGYVEAHFNLGNALLRKGSVDEAIAHYQKVLEIKPDYAEAHNNLGSALNSQGRFNEAMVHFQKALEIKPGYVEAHYNLGNALLRKGSTDEAIAHYRKALEIKPDYAEAQNNLARVLATSPQASLRNGNQAVKLAQQANQLTGGENPVMLSTLAAAYAEAGRFPEAVETAQRALQLTGMQSNTTLADAIRSQLKLYQAGLPFHLH
jgi:tetratricopeptide (TPR) repeat protein